MAAIREAFERFASGDFSGLAELPDHPEIVTSREVPDAGTYRAEAAREWLKAWIDSFESLTFEPVEILDAGDRVLVEFIQRGQPRGGDAPVELRTWSVTTHRGGIVVRFELFQNRAQALEAAGLSE